MSRMIEHGSTNQRIRCRVLDVGGAPYEGLAYDADGIAVFGQRLGSTASAITLAAGTGLNSEHSDGRWNEIGDGWYQIDAPDGFFASGVDSVLFYGSATGYTFIFEAITLVTSQTYPSNFESLGINASGHISRVTLVDTTTTNTDMRGTDSAYTGTPPTAGAISTQVAADLQTAHGSGSWQTATGFGDATAANQSTIIAGLLDAAGVRTALGMAAADLDTQLDAIAGSAGGLDAAGVRSAVGLASANLDTQLSDIDSAIGNIDVTGVIAMPLTADIPDRTQGRTIDVYTGETVTLAVAVRDINGDTVDLSGSDYDFLVWDKSQTTQIEATATGTSTGFSVTITPGTTPAQWQWAVRRQNATKERLAGGPFDVHYTPSAS